MIIINGQDLTLDQICAVARKGAPVTLDPQARTRMLKSRGWVEDIVRQDRPVYGINTGFGIFADRSISREDTERLNRNLMLSHAVGVGDPLPDEVVRAAMLVRANTLAKGYSGVRPLVVETLLEMLNQHVTPVIPAQGSLGSSGDLGPLSHLGLVLSCGPEADGNESGEAFYGDRRLSGKDAMAAAGIRRLVLGPKEGLALNNGATFSAAIAALAVSDAVYAYHVANAALALSLEGLQGRSAAFDDRIHQARGQRGQAACAREVRDLIAGSTLIDSAPRIQDAYCLRCAPQVHGAVLDSLIHVQDVVEREINAATDNPLLVGPEEALSGGNFHGEPVGLVMDFLSIAMAELGAISERRVFRLTDGKLNGGLPAMLVDSPQAEGLHSGLMMLQYTAASLALENQSLAAPDSVHSLPTSGGQEDHNANSTTAARHAADLVRNVLRILAIEVFTAARALDLRLRAQPGAKPAPAVADIQAALRRITPYHAEDRAWGRDLETLFSAVWERRFPLPNDPEQKHREETTREGKGQ